MNRTEHIGRVTADIELKQTQNKRSVVTFTIAVDRRSKEGGADFIPIVAWDTTAENTARYVKKGDRVGVTGRITTRGYKDKNGRTVKVVEVTAEEVEFLEPRKQANASQANPTFEETKPDGDLPF